MPRKRQSFLYGAFILSVATLAVKVIGAVFKLPLYNLLGGDGIGYFATAYNLFNPIYALAISGFPVAVSKLVSEQMALKRYRDVRRIYHVASFLFLLIGLLGSLLIFVFAGPFVQLVENEGAYLAVVAIAPSIFFCCVMSIYRGYYVGMSNMYPTAVSQVVEAFVKLGCGLWFGQLFMQWAQTQYQETGMVFGIVMKNAQTAQTAFCTFGAAGAILGMTVSTMAGAVYLFLLHKIKGDGITKEELRASAPPVESRQILRRLTKVAVPICLSAIIVNLTSLIDLVSLMNRISYALTQGSQEILSMYEGLIPAGKTLEEIPNYLYGSYQCAVTLFNLVPTLTTVFGVSALPAVTSAWALRNRREVKRNIESVIRITCLIAIPCGIGMSFLAEPILSLFFSSRPQEVAIAAPILQVMGIATIFVAVTTPINSMLQAVGKEMTPVKMMLVGGGIKLLLNYVLVAIPSLNIQGASYGTLACYLITTVWGMRVLLKTVGLKLDGKSVWLKPAFTGLCCGIAALGGYAGLQRIFPSQSLCTIGAILFAGIVYAILLFVVGAISKDDINMLPNGENIAKILEKHRLIR